MNYDLGLFDSQGILIHGMIGLALRTTGIELHEENFKEGSIPVCLVGTSAIFQISRKKFPEGGENVKSHSF